MVVGKRIIVLVSTLLFSFFVTIWGNLDWYGNDSVVVDGKKYSFGDNVTIDTYSLKKDSKGEVRVELNGDGKAKEVFFYGIDMPEAVRYYKRK